MRLFGTTLALALFSATAAAWVCPDNGSTKALANNQDPGNYRVKHAAGDTSLRCRVKNSEGEVTFDEDLPTDAEGLLVGVPLGGTVGIYDESDTDIRSGEGTIRKE
jgi:hypothetical protein